MWQFVVGSWTHSTTQIQINLEELQHLTISEHTGCSWNHGCGADRGLALYLNRSNRVWTGKPTTWTWVKTGGNEKSEGLRYNLQIASLNEQFPFGATLLINIAECAAATSVYQRWTNQFILLVNSTLFFLTSPISYRLTVNWPSKFGINWE